jgi:hypothetical protein
VTTAETVVNRVRSQLLSGQREEHNRLSGALTDSATSVTFEFDLGPIKTGAVLSAGSELMYVWSAVESTKTATVQRGWDGTTAAAHSSAALVTVNARFPSAIVLERVNDELRALSSPVNGLFKMSTVDLTFNAAVEGYNLTSVTAVIDIWDVRYKQAGSFKDWPRVHHWDFAPMMPAADFASGFALWVPEGEPGQTVRVWYKAPFTVLSGLSDDVETVSGLPATAIDVVEAGALVRLSAVRDVKRNFIEAQPPPRRAEEVPGGAWMDTAAGLRALRRDRIAEERARLQALYPIRRR